MRDYRKEMELRVEFIREQLKGAHANAIVFGNSGGKDSALVGILCKAACKDTVGVLLPCGVSRNFTADVADGRALAGQFGIETLSVDLTEVKRSMVRALDGSIALSETADINLAPRLRMTALYAIAASRGALVAGTGNASEAAMGYFTKWGDGAYDFNPIADLTATEVLEFLRELGAPESIVTKAPSAALKEGQTDEGEMGMTYAELDRYLRTGEGSAEVRAKVESARIRNAHKLRMPARYGVRS